MAKGQLDLWLFTLLGCVQIFLQQTLYTHFPSTMSDRESEYFFCERLWVSPQLETCHTKEYTNNMILKSVEKSVVFVKNFNLKPRKPCHSLHTSTLNYQAENTLPSGNHGTFNLLLTFKTSHTIYSPIKSFTLFKPKIAKIVACHEAS